MFSVTFFFLYLVFVSDHLFFQLRKPQEGPSGRAVPWVWAAPYGQHADPSQPAEGVQRESRRVEQVCTSTGFLCVTVAPHFPSLPHRLIVNARNAHLGPRNGAHIKAKSQKRSAQRREMMFENSAPLDPLLARRFPTILSTLVPQTRQVKHAATLQWVSPCLV